jgi:hypothetical protein
MKELGYIYNHLKIGEFEQYSPKFKKYLDKQHGTNVKNHQYPEEVIRMIETRWSKHINKMKYDRPA